MRMAISFSLGTKWIKFCVYCIVKLKDHNNGSLSVMKFVRWYATNETDPQMAIGPKIMRAKEPVVEEYTWHSINNR